MTKDTKQAIGISTAVIGGSGALIMFGLLTYACAWAALVVVVVAIGLTVTVAAALGRDQRRAECAALRARFDAGVRQQWP